MTSEIADTPPDLPAILGGVPIRPSGPPTWPIVQQEVIDALTQLAGSGDWGRYESGHVERLKTRLQELLSVPHCLLTSSGTAAVELALRGLRIEPRDEVILAGYDFKANFTNITLLGACPVLVDIHPLSGQIDVEQIASAITQTTRAILVSHLHGQTVPMPRLMEIARAARLPVIEDACQMGLTQISARPGGTWGDVGVLSFGGSKLLTAGRGGAVFTSRDDIQQRIRLYTERGNSAYPLSEMQAAVLVPQLSTLPRLRQQRADFVEQLSGQLASRPGLRLLSSGTPPDPQTEPDYYKVGFWYDPGGFAGLSRAQFCAAMRAEGIPLDPGFRSLDRIHARKRFRISGELENADRADESLVVLHHPFLLEGEQGLCELAAALDRLRSHATILQERIRC